MPEIEAAANGVTERVGEESLLDELLDEAVPLTADQSIVLHMADTFDAMWQTSLADDPHGRLSREESETDPLPRSIEAEIAEYYHGSALRNVGYWREDRFTPAEAARALVVELIALWEAEHPEEYRPSVPRVLAVGRGGSELAEVFDKRLPVATVDVIDPLDLLVRSQARRSVWGGQQVVERLQVDAPDAAYDLVLWVEATPGDHAAREEAWAEVRRVLRPAGALLAAEVLGRDGTGSAVEGCSVWPVESDFEDYVKRLETSGFSARRVLDVTHHAWFRYCRNSREYFTAKLLLHHLDRERLETILATLPGGGTIVEAYLMVYAAQFGNWPKPA